LRAGESHETTSLFSLSRRWQFYNIIFCDVGKRQISGWGPWSSVAIASGLHADTSGLLGAAVWLAVLPSGFFDWWWMVGMWPLRLQMHQICCRPH
jgi:hypothetical protein